MRPKSIENRINKKNTFEKIDEDVYKKITVSKPP